MIDKNVHVVGLKTRSFLSYPFVSICLTAIMFVVVASCGTEKYDINRNSERYVKDWGIEVLGIRETAAGYMLDFRYRVIDPEKASVLLKKSTRPYLVDQRTGATLVVPNPPKVGPLKSVYNPKKNRNYFIMFGNPGKFIKKGDKVTVVIGTLEIKDLVVQ